MTPPDQLIDHQDRATITESLGETLFVEAGAGSGKTSSLVSRIVNLVRTDGVPVTKIAAITFTEAAARELRTRVRDALEEQARNEEPGRAGMLEQAAGQVESAAFSTLHGFALRILSDHPIEADLPPGFGVVDEITSTLEFDESWRVFVGRIGDDMTLLELQERAAALNIDLRNFAGVARRFDDNWDLLDLVAPEPDRGEAPPALTDITFAQLRTGARALRDLADLCIFAEDKYLQPFLTYVDQLDQVADAGAIEQLQLLRTLKLPHRGVGKADNWRGPGLGHVRAQVQELHEQLQAEVDHYRNEVMEYFVTLVAGFVSDRVKQRQSKGELAYHDLLVLARRLLRSDEVVRQTLHQRYSRILLDEFQDTDPIQIELAVLLASAKPVGNTPWHELAADLPPGRLVVVGDPKQSIYRFRRADIGVYSRTEEVLVDQSSRLTTNFRTVPGVLAWVNTVFGMAMGDGEPGKQPPYVPLDPAREPGPTDEPPVTLLGGPHEKSVKIHRIREAEGADVAAVACRIMDEGWLVERDGSWLPARLKDIAVLIPSRLSLPALEAAFAATNVPFRPETNSLVYATQEVRDVLAAVRAVVNPTNSIDVVATLRSALFAIGDDELLDWKLLEGSWDYRAPLPSNDTGLRLVSADGDLVGSPLDIEVASHPVAVAYDVLRTWHEDRWWHDPATIIDRIVRDRRLREAALAEPRPRDRWRRYRFLAEQAREFTETQGGDLHDFVDWVEVQSSDMARVTEPVPAEPDDDAVRVLTIHGAKGLEFPIVVLAGAPTEESRGRSGPQVIFPPDGRPQVRLGADRQTALFDVHASMEEVLDAYERIRLHYVAATRARDHLIVSAHHKTGKRNSIGKRTWEASADCPELWRPFEARGDEHYASQPPTQLRLAGGGYRQELEEWTAVRSQIMTTAQDSRHWSATALAEAARELAEPESGSVSPIPPVDADDLVGPAGFPGTYQEAMPGFESSDHATVSFGTDGVGAALGSAVHAALEVVDFERPGDLGPLARSTAASHGVPELAPEVERRVAAALASPTIALARTNTHWRELYVAIPSGPEGTGTVEGFIDLCIETDQGLLVVDYKTDGVGSAADVAAKVAHYRIQGATYALALSHVAGRPVVGCRFVFIGADGAIEADVEDLETAVTEVRQLLHSDGS